MSIFLLLRFGRLRLVAALALAWSITFVALRAECCSCGTWQPQVLLPQPGRQHGLWDPLLFASNEPVRPFLYDADGKLVGLGGPVTAHYLGQCTSTIQALRTYALGPGRYTLILQSERYPDVVRHFDMVEQYPALQRSELELTVTKKVLGSYILVSSLCNEPRLDGATIVAMYEARFEIQPSVALFAEAWVDDSEWGLIRNLGSSFLQHGASTSWTTAGELFVVVPVTETSSDCLQVALYDWAFEHQRSEEFCLSDGARETRRLSIDVRLASLPADGQIEIPPRPVEPSGCSLTARRQLGPPPGGLLGAPLATILVLARRYRRVLFSRTGRRNRASWSPMA